MVKALETNVNNENESSNGSKYAIPAAANKLIEEDLVFYDNKHQISGRQLSQVSIQSALNSSTLSANTTNDHVTKMSNFALNNRNTNRSNDNINNGNSVIWNRADVPAVAVAKVAAAAINNNNNNNNSNNDINGNLHLHQLVNQKLVLQQQSQQTNAVTIVAASAATTKYQNHHSFIAQNPSQHQQNYSNSKIFYPIQRNCHPFEVNNFDENSDSFSYQVRILLISSLVLRYVTLRYITLRSILFCSAVLFCSVHFGAVLFFSFIKKIFYAVKNKVFQFHSKNISLKIINYLFYFK